jgi:hypothetical protein
VAVTLVATVWHDALRIMIPYLALIVAVIVLGTGVLWVRKRVLAAPESKAEPGQLFTLEELRQLRAEGSLTETEYQTMKAAMIEALTGDGTRSNRGNSPLSSPVPEEPGQVASGNDKNEDWDWVSPDFDLKNRPER